ncbi:hypothetical protein MYCTH_2129400 [Thermothelomyces thermophilus ATCC 42464]|uniref:Squalene epoxidase domain-containing protein n=1 Tax=Thermothelomyces thermophilus (strain ATCC 42464 / BCRC 31852 / DSM 1799) TaxID=573729 RepID=G2QID4_THET4|nr:uncharacterized protein MYCTH_2129400 [Thermothelomyces thermophilus ATCC 42464]AEO60308.1 hypothetical protein MYCTH_2129400 [Thermothelomyces thermophilus ATCC 42464]
MLGDSSNMRNPVTGADVTVAPRGAVLLADLPSPKRIPPLEAGTSLLVLILALSISRHPIIDDLPP